MFTGVALMGSYFNVCSIVDGTVSEELGGVALLEVESLGMGFEDSKAHTLLPHNPFCLQLVVKM